MSVLGDLFAEIASAIRSKNTSAGTMKPAEFADRIMEIVVGTGESGGSSGSVSDSSTIQMSSGYFNTGVTGTNRQTIYHNTGIMPDFAIVFKSTSTEIDTSKNPLLLAWGIKDEIGTAERGSAIFANSAEMTLAGIDQRVDDLFYDTSPKIYCFSKNAFHVGVNDLSGSGEKLFAENSNYRWIIMSGFGNNLASAEEVSF